ncbi:hypothetical protein C2E23DRAFT_856622 [Lenzites betulinus]|nr:hypothetical protein C2E23DRAFT_856622 [Lenzites betulinus]
MKFALVFLALAGSAMAQSIALFAPAANTAVAAGSDLLVDIEKLPGLSGPTDVSVAIGLRSCGNDCSTIVPANGLGQLLFQGYYKPQLTPGSGSSAGFQNYTVHIPVSAPKGPAALIVAHFFLGGAALAPGFEVVSTNIVVQ